MFDDHEDADERIIGPAPPWLHLLQPAQRAWRETEILKGRDPDGYIESRLREAGVWPEMPKAPDESALR